MWTEKQAIVSSELLDEGYFLGFSFRNDTQIHIFSTFAV